MKKLCFIMILCFIYVFKLDAQDSTRFVYCEIIGEGKFLSNKVTIYVDFGQFTKFGGERANILDPMTGKPIAFNSMIDAMNYMGKDRWEFVQAFVVSTSNGFVYHYLLKKSYLLLDEETKKQVDEPPAQLTE